jgi:putative Mg2+ transporter-C (MgtC) family protein
VRGINTAATLWASAAVGAFAGSGQFGEAVLVATFVLAGNTLLRPVANYVNRKPISPSSSEAVYRIHVTCRPEMVADARDLIHEELEQRQYPIREIETLSETPELIELAAALVPTTANPEDLDAVTRHLEKHEAIESATWTVSTES